MKLFCFNSMCLSPMFPDFMDTLYKVWHTLHDTKVHSRKPKKSA